MKTNQQIAADAAEKMDFALDLGFTPDEEKRAITIILAAIEEAWDEGNKWGFKQACDIHNARAAASKEHKLTHDWNKDLPVTTHLTPPAQASDDVALAKRLLQSEDEIVREIVKEKRALDDHTTGSGWSPTDSAS